MPHFVLVLDDGTFFRRKDGSVMEFRPASYMAIMEDQFLIFHKDCREVPTIQFFGGGVEIYVDPVTRRLTYEMPPTAARRELFEEGGAVSIEELFIGNFAILEPVFLFKSTSWNLPSGEFVMQSGEVSEIVKISVEELACPQRRIKSHSNFLGAQWEMLGWLMLHLKGQTKPVFERWYEHDPWEILDSLQ